MLAAGVLPGVWFTDPHFMALCPPDAAFVVAEVEGSSDFEGVVSSIPHLEPGMPHAIITTFDGLLVKDSNGVTDPDATASRCKPLIDAGFYCQYEAYFMSQPDNTDANYCGFPAEMVAPVLGIGFNGKTLWQQTALQVPGHGVYLAEYLTP